jgi:predicted nuclease of predicted toxin-antitoxin system
MGISPKVIPILASLGHEGYHWASVGLAQASDREISDDSIKYNSLILTTDVGFSNLAVFEQRAVPGIIILRLQNPNAKQMIASIQELLDGPFAESIEHSITVIEPYQIRQTKLPLT